MNAKAAVVKLYSDFQEYMYSNNVLVAASGFSIGVATKEMVQKVLELVVLPLAQCLMHVTLLQKAYRVLVMHTSKKWVGRIVAVLAELSWTISEWLLLVVLTFLLLEYVLNRKIVGLTSSVKVDEIKDFASAKQAAKTDNIIPLNADDIMQMRAKQLIEKEEVKQVQRHEQRLLQKAASEHFRG
jgi:large-conductance mechanosensitive channel